MPEQRATAGAAILGAILLIRRHALTPFFFFNDTATTEIYTLSLHDALPISAAIFSAICCSKVELGIETLHFPSAVEKHLDRKSTRLNSSHLVISYAVFCLKKKNNDVKHITLNDTTHALHHQYILSTRRATAC